jgi:hypothetical protein
MWPASLVREAGGGWRMHGPRGRRRLRWKLTFALARLLAAAWPGAWTPGRWGVACRARPLILWAWFGRLTAGLLSGLWPSRLTGERPAIGGRTAMLRGLQAWRRRIPTGMIAGLMLGFTAVAAPNLNPSGQGELDQTRADSFATGQPGGQGSSGGGAPLGESADGAGAGAGGVGGVGSSHGAGGAPGSFFASKTPGGDAGPEGFGGDGGPAGQPGAGPGDPGDPILPPLPGEGGEPGFGQGDGGFGFGGNGGFAGGGGGSGLGGGGGGFGGGGTGGDPPVSTGPGPDGPQGPFDPTLPGGGQDPIIDPPGHIGDVPADPPGDGGPGDGPGKLPILPPIEGGTPPGGLHPIQPIPEPATWMTMILGFAAAGGALRRRRARTALN